jgi:hypothetical protein
MARTAITVSPFVRDGGLTDPAGTTIDSTNGMTVTANTGGGGTPVADPGKMLLRVTNTAAAAYSVILRGSGYTGLPAGAVNSGIPPVQNTVYTQATVGDLAVSVATTGVAWLGPFSTDRFAQPDGSLSVDFSSTSFAGKITAFQLPFVVPS